MSFKPIKFLRLSYLRGPNIWTYHAAVEALIDIGELEDHPSNTIPGFNDRLTTWLPGLLEHHCGVGYRGGFLERLRDGTWPGHIMEHVAIELHNLAGLPTAFGKARSTEQRGVYKVVVRTGQEQVGRQALHDARDLVMAAVNNEPFDLNERLDRLKRLIELHALGPSTRAIVNAAVKRKIPHIRLIDDGNLVQLGYGAHQRRIWTAETDKTSAIAEGISRDKELTKDLLQSCGVPIPQGRAVDNAQDAWEAAQDIGVPVVVKPVDANRGRGVVLDLRTQEQVEAAYDIAAKVSSDVMVEKMIDGEEHRLLIIGGKLIAAVRGELSYIRGDGRSTVAQLVDTHINADPRRGEEEHFPLNPIRLPANRKVMLELQRQGLTPESVPEAGRDVLLERNGVLNQDITDEVHPSVAEMAALAARIVGLDIAGVDVVASNISRPLEDQGGAIIEVNAGPGLLMHLQPAVGQPRPVGEAIVEHLLGPTDDGRIPVVGLTGGEPTTPIAQLLTWMLHSAGLVTGLACSEGLFLRMQKIDSHAPSDWEAGQRMLMSPNVNAVVIENSPRSILDDGLSYDRCHVGVVTSVPLPEGLADHHILTQEQMRTVLRTQVDVVLPQGCAVLNADDEVCASLAELCDGDVIFYSTRGDGERLQSILGEERRLVLVHNGQIVLQQRNTHTVLLDLAQSTVAHLLQRHLTLPELLATVAAALAMGLSPALVRAGIETCSTVFPSV
jgi:cyanophycin synthetase